MVRAVSSTLMIFIVILPLWAGEVYMWTDGKGVKHITETPPPKSNIKVDTMKYKRDESIGVNLSQERQKIKEETGNPQIEKNAGDLNQQLQKLIQVQPKRRPEEQQPQEVNLEQELEKHRVKEEDRRVEEKH